MATRSLIARQNDDGTVTAIYCHYDGYPEGVGRTLLDNYTDPDKVDALLALGNLSALGSELGSKHDFYAHHTDHREWCLAYGRDREETGQESVNYSDRFHLLSSAQGAWAEYVYVFETDWTGRGRWTVAPIFGHDLATVLGEREEVTA